MSDRGSISLKLGLAKLVIRMRHVPIRFVGCLILCLAGFANHTFVGPSSVFGEDAKSQTSAPPKIDHILLEVSNLTASIAFYRDFLGLRLKSWSIGFVRLESGKNRARATNAKDWECILISR